jgi:hypothetical protein
MAPSAIQRDRLSPSSCQLFGQSCPEDPEKPYVAGCSVRKGFVQRAPRSGEYLESINPATGELFARFPKGEAIDIDDAVNAASKAFPIWWALPPLQRSSLL